MGIEKFIDVNLVKEAEKMLGNKIADVVEEALKKAIEAEKAKQEGYRKEIIKVGSIKNTFDDTPEVREYKFFGKKLGEFKTQDIAGNEGKIYTLYLLRDGRCLLHINDWITWQNEVSYLKYEIYDSFDEFVEEEEEYLGVLIDAAKKEIKMDPVNDLNV